MNNRCAPRSRRILAAVTATLLLATAGLAQMPTSPWKKGAPFPEPDEELYGVAVQRQTLRDRRLGRRQGPRAPTTSTTRRTDKWTKKASMPRPAHHAALAAVNGKIYVFGGFVAPATTAIPLGGAWEPIDDAWEFNPATDSWKPLAPLPGKRGSAIAAEVGGKIYVIGGATTMDGDKEPFFTAFGPAQVLATNDVYDPATNKWESRNADVGAAQSRVQRRRQRQDLRHRRPHRPRASSCRRPTRMWSKSTTQSPTRGACRRSGCRPLAAAGPRGPTAAGFMWPAAR